MLLLLLVSSGVHGANPTEYLSIYLLANKADEQAALSGQADRTKITLEPQPILVDHDFTAYDTKTGEFFVKAEAAKGLCHELKEKMGKNKFTEPRMHGNLGLGYGFDYSDTPFVLKAMHERVYTGVFSTTLSSRTYGCPVVMPVDMFIPANSTNEEAFGFAPAFEDKRIVAAVGKLSLITNRPSLSPVP